jgi:hypothetical protein
MEDHESPAGGGLPATLMERFGGIGVGDHFGKLTVVRRTENRGRHACWECHCTCGGNKVVRGDRLRNGSTASCGCAQRYYQERRLVEIEESVTFKTFGKVFVLGTAREFKGRKQAHAVCVCTYCSGTSVQRASDVLRRNFRGCVCRYIGTIHERVSKHGFPPPWPVDESEPIEVTAMRAEWRSIIARCHNPNNRDYRDGVDGESSSANVGETALKHFSKTTVSDRLKRHWTGRTTTVPTRQKTALGLRGGSRHGIEETRYSLSIREPNSHWQNWRSGSASPMPKRTAVIEPETPGDQIAAWAVTPCYGHQFHTFGSGEAVAARFPLTACHGKPDASAEGTSS